MVKAEEEVFVHSTRIVIVIVIIEVIVGKDMGDICLQLSKV